MSEPPTFYAGVASTPSRRNALGAPVDVICRAKLVLGEDGSLHCSVTDGAREFELDAAEVERLWLAIGRWRRRRAKGDSGAGGAGTCR